MINGSRLEIQPLGQPSDLIARELLVEHLKEEEGVATLLTENYDVPLEDDCRFTAIFITPQQAETIKRQAKPNSFVWDYFGDPKAAKLVKVIPNLLPVGDQDQIIRCLDISPVRGHGPTEIEAIWNAYQLRLQYKAAQQSLEVAETDDSLEAMILNGTSSDKFIPDDPVAVRIKQYGMAALKVTDFESEEGKDSYKTVLVPLAKSKGLPPVHADNKEIVIFEEEEHLIVADFSEDEAVPWQQEAHLLSTSSPTPEEADIKAYGSWLKSQVYWAQYTKNLPLQ